MEAIFYFLFVIVPGLVLFSVLGWILVLVLVSVSDSFRE